MLVLARRLNERIRIKLPDGRFIWLTVVEAARGQARLGLDAPREIEVMREELIADQPGDAGRC